MKNSKQPSQTNFNLSEIKNNLYQNPAALNSQEWLVVARAVENYRTVLAMDFFAKNHNLLNSCRTLSLQIMSLANCPLQIDLLYLYQFPDMKLLSEDIEQLQGIMEENNIPVPECVKFHLLSA